MVIYSPDDLSCDWNQIETQSDLPRVTRSTRIGQNVVDYATGRELPADKLSTPEVKDFKSEPPKRGALRIAKLRHAGDWNIAPLAIPNLTTTLRDKLKFDVVINHKELFPRDPNLVHYPLIYIHGRAALSFDAEDKAALRRHLDPGGGTLFADAACGSPAFDAAFRKFVAELLPGNPMIPIPRDDELYTAKIHFDLKDVQYTKAGRRRQGPPPARRGEGQRPLGRDLLQVRHRLRPRTAPGARLQGLHLRERHADRREHRDLFHLALKHRVELVEGIERNLFSSLLEPLDAVDVGLRVELLAGALVAHEPDHAEDRPLAPGAVVLAADGPGHACVAVGVPAVHEVAVVHLEGEVEGGLGVGGPFEDLLGPVHPQIVVHPARDDHLLLRGVPERVAGLAGFE